jgi:hypothetical protein
VRKRERVKARKLVVPLVLTVSVVAGALTVTSMNVGCGDDAPPADAGTGDGMPDTPII